MRYRIVGSRVEFTRAIEDAHRKPQMGVGRWLAAVDRKICCGRDFKATIISNGMSVPLVFLDVTISAYRFVSRCTE